jgi:hypothetical protein
MHFRRIACWLLGAWFVGSIAISRITSSNYAAVDRVLESPTPEIHRVAISRGRPLARSLMRYMATDLNRDYYTQWERTQIVLGLSIVVVLFIDSRKRALIILALAAMVLVAFQHYWVTPEILAGEQSRSFPDKNAPAISDLSLDRIKMLYTSVEIAKLLLLFALSFVLIKMQGKESRTRRRRSVDPDARELPLNEPASPVG